MEDNFLSQAQLDAIIQECNSDQLENENESLPQVAGVVLPSGYFSISIIGRSLGLKDSTVVFTMICKKISVIEQHIILNLQNCTYLSSTALGSIARLATERKARGWKLVLIGASEIIVDVIRLVDLERFLAIFKTEQEAIAYLDSF